MRLFLFAFLIGILFPRLSYAGDCESIPAPSTPTEQISCTTPRPDTEVWRIERPNVVQPQTTYTGIRFQVGDLINVFAGGCAQRGGSGRTWARYVNPMTLGRDDDDQHHGTIKLPGFGGVRHIRDAVLQGGIPVLADPGSDAQLVLGYLDDGYGDNGYWGHDDGWYEQCNDLPDAWVVIVIEHNCATSTAPDCIHGRALDLVSDHLDDNGFPVNPDWVYRRLTGTTPNATDVCGWSTKIGGFPVDDASLCASALTQHDGYWGCVQGGTPGDLAGHMNWIDSPVTYAGWIWWDSHDYWWDDDYTLNVAALDATKHVTGALFVDGQTNPQVEFNSEETIDQFAGVPFWSGLHSAVDLEDERKYTANATVNGYLPKDFFPGGTEGIVIGQLGLDCGHSCGTELHPAWGLFIHVKDDPSDDEWAFFVRNWGNEGYCSTNDHQPGAIQTFTVRLPRLWANAVTVLKPQTLVGSTVPVPPWTIQMATDGDGALVTINLPPANQHGVVFGELHLGWKLSLPAPLVDQLTRVRRPTADGFARFMIQQKKGDGGATEDLSTEEQLTRIIMHDNAKVRNQIHMMLRAGAPPVKPVQWIDGRLIVETTQRAKAIAPTQSAAERREADMVRRLELMKERPIH